MKYYRNYLPNYLGGPNIDRHSTILEEEDASVYDGLSLLELWCNLPRPLMIQREAVSLNNIHMIVRVDIPQIIKKITITGEYNYTIEYDEVDITTTAEIDFYVQGSTSTLKNPDITVTVETYDEITYTKAYPENDTTTGDLHDHDEFLDRIGNLLGIPRRVYKSYSFEDAENSMPPYNGKTIETVNNEDIVQSCTEDDYYYQERLQYYLSNFNKMALPILLLKTIYGYEHVTEANTALIESWGILEHIQESGYELPEQVQAGTYLFLVNQQNPVNIDTLTDEEKLTFIDKYIPVTRNAIILPQLLTTTTLEGSIIDGTFPKGYDHVFHARVIDQYNTPIKERNLTFTVDGQPADISTPTNNTGRASATFRNMNMGYHTVKVENPTGHGYEGSSDKHMYKSYLDERQIYDIPGQIVPLGGVYDELPAVPCDDCPYMLLYSISTNHPCRIKIDLINNNGTLSNIAVSEDIYGIHSVAVYPDTMQVFVDGVEVDVTVDDTVIFNPHDCQYKVLLECDGITHVYRDWITDYHIYNQGNVELDEFTLLYIVDVPENDNTYTCTLGHTTNGFSIDLFDFEEMIGDCTGLHRLEYKFLNYQCYLYIDNNLVSQFDFETNTQIDDPLRESLIHSHPLVTYLQSPTLTTDYTESYIIPITDYMSIPEHRGLLDTILTVYAAFPGSSEPITQVYTCNKYQGSAFELHMSLATVGRNQLRQLITGNVQIHTTFDNHPTPIESDATVKITETKTVLFEGDINAAGSVTFDIVYPQAWMRKPTDSSLTVEILPTPCRLHLEDNNLDSHYNLNPYYTSPTMNIDFTAMLEQTTVPGLNGQQQPIQGEDIQVYYDEVLIDDTYTTGVDGTVAVDNIPVGTSVGVHMLAVEYQGNNLHLEEYDEEDIRIEYSAAEGTYAMVEVLQNYAQFDVDMPESVPVNTDIPCTVTVTDLNDDPVTQTHVYVKNSFVGINLMAVPDEDGVCEFTIPGISSERRLNLTIYNTSNYYCKQAKVVEQVDIVEE